MTPDIAIIPLDDPTIYFSMTDSKMYDKASRDRAIGKTHTVQFGRECILGYAAGPLILEGNEKKSRLYNAMTGQTILVNDFERAQERLRAVTEDEEDAYHAWKHQKSMESIEEVNYFLDIWDLSAEIQTFVPQHFNFSMNN